MAFLHSRREIFCFYNHLTGLTKAMEGWFTTIDLRNESSVTGKILFVDGHMNIDLEDVVFYDQRGTETPFDRFFIRARNIRYVHIPKGMNVIDTIKNFNLFTKQDTRNTKKTAKNIRALRKQKETLEEIKYNKFK